MSLTPEYGEEQRVRQQSEEMTEQSERGLPQDREDAPERELTELDRADREVTYLDPEANEAHAPGQVCARCGTAIAAGQDARMRADGRWVHELCPQEFGQLPAESAGP